MDRPPIRIALGTHQTLDSPHRRRRGQFGGRWLVRALGKRRIGEGGEAAAREVAGPASCSVFYGRAGPDLLGSAGRLSVVGIAGERATRRREEAEWTDSPDRASVPALRDARSATQGQRQVVVIRTQVIGFDSSNDSSAWR